jgi:hypothetical protein
MMDSDIVLPRVKSKYGRVHRSIGWLSRMGCWPSYKPCHGVAWLTVPGKRTVPEGFPKVPRKEPEGSPKGAVNHPEDYPKGKWQS